MKTKSTLASVGLLSAVAGAFHFAPRAGAEPALDTQGKIVLKRVDRALRGVLKNQNGTPLNLKLSPTTKAGQGYFSDIQISGKQVMLKKMFVSEFALHSKNVRVDVPSLLRENKVRTLAAQTHLRVVVSENDLTKMLAQGKGTKDMKLKIKYIGGTTMRITGVLNYSFVNGPVAGTAKLRRGKDSNIYLDILSLQLRGVEAPGFVKTQLAGRLNPVIKVGNVPFSPQFRTLKVVGNKAIIST